MGPTSKKAALFSCAAIIALSLGSAAWAAPRNFDVPAQDAVKAIPEFGRQAGVQLVAPADRLKGVRTIALRGAMEVRDALAMLLRGTGLVVASDDGRLIVLKMSSDAQPSSSAADAAPPTKEDEKKTETTAEEDRKVERVVVTGTNIRGRRPKSSPLETYTREDIERSGATTTEGFVERLPQNLGTRTQYASGINTVDPLNSNQDAVSSPDLRGLGAGTTLVLLNGRRLSSSDFGQAVDISMIPLGAIERVEVLTDGASAIYGSDAIGGVVNFVLRSDFEGAETRLNYGTVTGGNLQSGEGSQLFGYNWGSGYAMASYNFRSASSLRRTDRDYAASTAPGTLTPIETRDTTFLTLSQDVGDRLVVSGDFAFGRRDIKTETFARSPLSPEFSQFAVYRGESDRTFANVAADYRITDSVNASLVASYSESDLDNKLATVNSFNDVPYSSPTFDFGSNSSVLDVTGKVDASLFDLPGGDVRVSVGGGILDESYVGDLTTAGFPSAREVARQTAYAFGEIFAPLVGDKQQIPMFRRLELSLAGRYTRIDDTSEPATGQDFGDAFDPKIGLYWEPFEAFGLRGTYGTSFRAPSMTILDPSGAFTFLSPMTIAGLPAENLSVTGYSAELKPETAETYTLGFDFRPRPEFRLSGTYYNIDYTDRIGIAPVGGNNPFTNPELLPDFIFRAQSADAIQNILDGRTPFLFGITLPGVDLSDPAAVAAAIFALPNLWIVDGRFKNLAVSKQDGIDLAVDSTFQTSSGSLSFGARVTRILSYQQQGSPSASLLTVVDYLGLPVDLRGRFYAGFSHEGFNATINVNYTDDYESRSAGTITPIDSWTTTDVNVTYDFEESDLRLSLSVTNVFDVDPPQVQHPFGLPQIGFDTANANPLGRMVTVGLTKQW